MKVDITGSVRGFSRDEITAFARRVLQSFDHPPVREVSIAFVDDAAMRRLNRRYRRRNRTTDVLTFDSVAPGLLGDIVISIDQARRQAAAEKHSLPMEIRYLILHGLLHALGHDHETDEGQMNALEMEVRRRVGLE